MYNNFGCRYIFKAKKSKEDLNIAWRNFGLFDRHLNLVGPADTTLPTPGFLVTVKAFYDNNFLAHFGGESELRYELVFSNRTGFSCPAGQRDRSPFVVPGQRDNGTSSKSCHRTGRARTACQNPGWDAGQDNHYFSVKIWEGTRDGPTLFFSYDFLF